MKPRFVTRRRLAVVVALLAAFTVVGFFVLPPIVKSQLEKRLSAELDRKVTVEKVRVNPYALSLTLEDFAIRERDGKSVFVGWRRLYVNFGALASIWGEWVLSDIELEGFEAHGQLNADQSFNFSDLLKKFAPKAGEPPGKPGRPIRIGRLDVSQARISISDLSQATPFATVLGPLTFTVTGFRTVSQRGAPYRFEAVTELGEKLAWSGTLQAEPFRSVGELHVENIVLPKYSPYYAQKVQADLVSGTLSVRGHYELSLDEKQRVMRLKDGALQLRSIKLLERGTQNAVFELPALDVAGVDADALLQKGTIGSIVLTGGQVRARREKDGSINLLKLAQAPAPARAPLAVVNPTISAPQSAGAAVSANPSGAQSAGAAKASAAAKLPDLTVGEVALKDFRIEVLDEAAPRPAQLGVSALQVSLKKVSLAQGARMPLAVSFTLTPSGEIALVGDVGIAPVFADLKLEVKGAEILSLSPYLEQFANVRITQGRADAALTLQAELPADKPLIATVSGDMALEKFGLVDGVANEDLAGLSSLALRGLRASTSPELSLSLNEVSIVGPYARVLVNADKSINLLAALPAKPATPAENAPPPASTAPTNQAENSAAPAASLPRISIDRVVISDGDFRFTDRSVEPAVSMAIGQFGGTVSGLSSTNLAKADVDLRALVDGAGPVSITGKLDPLGVKKAVDLKIDFKNVDLVPLSPYSGKFAGYELARGKLMLDVKFLLDGEKIDSANVITLNQFTFGGPVASTEATKLPVRLGVALLKDMDGKIVIDVPVQGSLGDPEFRIGRVVVRVIVNLLTKAAVSPFSLLGAAFGGGGDELGYQDFAPGSTEIQASEMKKLDTLVQALTNRPGLSLDIEGGFDAAADAYALRRTKLAAQISRAIWEEKRLKDPNIAPPEKLAITPEENAAMVKKLFDAKFPPGTQFGTPVPPPPAIVSPPAPPSGFFTRVIRAITFAEQRERRAAKKENEQLAAAHTKAVEAAIAAGLPLEEMVGRLAETVTVDANDLRALAQARAQRIRAHFVDAGKIAPDRLFLAKEQTSVPKEGKGPRVFLHLQ